MSNYIPGKGYRDGWADRYGGKPKACPEAWGCATTDDSVYWSEYGVGYREASVKILEEAKQDIQKMKQDVEQYLIEDVLED
jgi:hypothetical protein